MKSKELKVIQRDGYKIIIDPKLDEREKSRKVTPKDVERLARVRDFLLKHPIPMDLIQRMRDEEKTRKI